MPAATTSTAYVDDEHVVVPADVVDPVVVSFDGQYVWSFVPRRDGSRRLQGWQVPWPVVLRARLDGTTCVRLTDAGGARVHFEAPVSFRGNKSRLTFCDSHGHPLAVDRTGHLTRVFSETAGDARRQIAEGTARAIADLREKVGIDAHVSYGCLLGAVRDGRMIGHDSDSDLAYISAHTHPADIVRESFRIEREMRQLGWNVVRMSGADLKLLLPLPDGRVVHVDVFAAFHVEGPSTRWVAAADASIGRPSRPPRRSLSRVWSSPRRAVPRRCSSSSTVRGGASPTPHSSQSTPGKGCAASMAGCAVCVRTSRTGTRSSASEAARSRAGARRSRSGPDGGCPRMLWWSTSGQARAGTQPGSHVEATGWSPSTAA